MKIEILDSTKKKKFLQEVANLTKDEKGFKMNELFLKAGKEQVRIYSGSLHADDILKIWREFPIESVGLYFGKSFVDKHGRKESRVSLDGLHVVKDQVNNFVVELDKEQVEKWFKGNNIELTEEQKDKYQKFVKNFVAVQDEETKNFIGTAKLNEQGILYGFLPKERRIPL